MTTWTYKVGKPARGFIGLNGKKKPSLGTAMVSIELDRGGMLFKSSGTGVPDTYERLYLHENNALQLLFFAQQLISIINETHPEWVLKNRIVVSSKAIRDFRSEEFSNES